MPSTSQPDAFSWENSGEISEVDNHLSYIGELKGKYTWHRDYGKQISSLISSVRARKKNEKLNISVIGEFSTGKSAFVNAFLKTDLTAVQVLQGTTAAATIIEYSPKYEMQLSNHVTGKKTQFSFGGFEELKNKVTEVTTDYNIARELSSVHIGLPEARSLGNIRIIDTPGTNVEYEWQEEATLRIIENLSDCSVILVDATQVLPRSLVDFIRNRLEHILPQCVFVVTKTDCLRPKECPAVVDYIRKRISQEFNIENPVVLPYSSALVIGGKEENSLYGLSIESEGEIVRHFIKQRAVSGFKKILSLTDRMYSCMTDNIQFIRDYVLKEQKQTEALKAKLSGNPVLEKRNSVITEYEISSGKVRKNITDSINAASHTSQFTIMSTVEKIPNIAKLNNFIKSELEQMCKTEAGYILKVSENSAKKLYESSAGEISNSYKILTAFYDELKKTYGDDSRFRDILSGPPVMNRDILKDITENSGSSGWILPSLNVTPVEGGGGGILGGINNKALVAAKTRIRTALKIYFDDVVNMAATHIENCISITGNHISSEYNKYVSLYNRILKIKMNDINLKERMYDYQIKEINSDLQGIEARLFRTESLRSNLNKV